MYTSNVPLTKFTVDNCLPRPYMKFPFISQYCIGWRMGFGECYAFIWMDWYEALSADEKNIYDGRFPKQPIFWENGPNKSILKNTNLIPWRKFGEPAYTKEIFNSIKETLAFPENPYNNQNHPYVFFSPYYLKKFRIDSSYYKSVSHYVCLMKLELCLKDKIDEYKEQMSNPSTNSLKTLSATIEEEERFKKATWKLVEHTYLLMGYYYSISQDQEARKALMATGNKILICEGDSEFSKKVGFALMEVRDEMNRIYENEKYIDWEGAEKV